MNIDMNELFKRIPLVFVVLGVLLLIIAAFRGIPFGGQPTLIMDELWRYILATSGVILLLIGIVLVVQEYRQSRSKTNNQMGFRSEAVLRFDSGTERVHYTLERIAEAKKGIYDLSWERPLKTPVAFSPEDGEKYLNVIESASRRVRYREIIMFCGNEGRVTKAKRLISTAGKYYELAGYVDAPENSPPRKEFVIIDDEEVIFDNLAVKQPEIVKYFRRYYDDLWGSATPIKVGDVKDLTLLEYAEKSLS